MPATLYLSHDVPLPRGLTLPDLRVRLRAMMKELKLQTGQELSVLLTNDEHIHQLNRDYRHKNKPTDVLAFALCEGEGGSLDQAVLGDVVVSLETAAAQAKAADKRLLAEVTMLLGHGVLHLLGWDHDTKAKDLAMRAETDKLIACAEKASKTARAKAKAKALLALAPAPDAPKKSRRATAEAAPAAGKQRNQTKKVAPKKVAVAKKSAAAGRGSGRAAAK